MLCGPQVRCIRPCEVKQSILFLLDTTSDFCLGMNSGKLVWNKTKISYKCRWCLQAQTVPIPKGKYLSPPTPFPVWGHCSSRAAKGQGPQLSLWRQEVQFKEKEPLKWRGGKGRDQLGDSLIYSKEWFLVWSVESLMSLRPFYEIHGVQPTYIVLLRYYVTFHYVDIYFEVKLHNNGDHGSKLQQ